MNKLLIHSKSIPASVTVGGVLFEAVAQDASGNGMGFNMYHISMGGTIFMALESQTPVRLGLSNKKSSTEYFTPAEWVLAANADSRFSKYFVASVVDVDADWPTLPENINSALYTLSGAKDPTAVYSNQLVNAQTSSGQLVLNFNVAKSEPPNVNIALDWTITCDAGKEKGILSEIFNSISNSSLDVVDVSLLPNVKTLTSSYDITP
jgi:hypothetical protein